MRGANADIARLLKFVVYLVLIVVVVSLSPLILALLFLRALLHLNKPKKRGTRHPARKQVKSKTTVQADPALKYGSKGTWMYNEAKRWGTDPRLYED